MLADLLIHSPIRLMPCLRRFDRALSLGDQSRLLAAAPRHEGRERANLFAHSAAMRTAGATRVPPCKSADVEQMQACADTLRTEVTKAVVYFKAVR